MFGAPPPRRARPRRSRLRRGNRPWQHLLPRGRPPPATAKRKISTGSCLAKQHVATKRKLGRWGGINSTIKGRGKYSPDILGPCACGAAALNERTTTTTTTSKDQGSGSPRGALLALAFLISAREAAWREEWLGAQRSENRRHATPLCIYLFINNIYMAGPLPCFYLSSSVPPRPARMRRGSSPSDRSKMVLPPEGRVPLSTMKSTRPNQPGSPAGPRQVTDPTPWPNSSLSESLPSPMMQKSASLRVSPSGTEETRSGPSSCRKMLKVTCWHPRQRRGYSHLCRSQSKLGWPNYLIVRDTYAHSGPF